MDFSHNQFFKDVLSGWRSVRWHWHFAAIFWPTSMFVCLVTGYVTKTAPNYTTLSLAIVTALFCAVIAFKRLRLVQVRRMFTMPMFALLRNQTTQSTSAQLSDIMTQILEFESEVSATMIWHDTEKANLVVWRIDMIACEKYFSKHGDREKAQSAKNVKQEIEAQLSTLAKISERAAKTRSDIRAMKSEVNAHLASVGVVEKITQAHLLLEQESESLRDSQYRLQLQYKSLVGKAK